MTCVTQRARRYRSPASRWPRSASTPCSPSAGSSPRARARPRRSWRARCASAAAAASARPSRASSWPRTSRWRSTSARASSRAAGSSSPTRSTRPGVDPAGRRCLDVGASTGGFTDCLLQRGRRARRRARRRLRRARLALRTDERVTVLERTNARALAPGDLPYAPGPGRGRRLVHLADQGAARRCSPAARQRFDALAMVKPQFEVGRERVGKGGVVRDARGPPRGARRGGAGRARRSAPRCSASRRRGCPGPKGNRETFVWLAEAGRDGALTPTSRRAAARGRAVTVRARTATVLSPRAPGADRRGAARAHRRPPSARASLLRFDAEETRKYGLDAARRASCSTRRSATTSSCASSLGGDGTILRALRRYAGTSVPVFAVNYGEVGFLATIDPDEDGDLLGAFERGAGRRLRDADAARARARDARRARRRRSTTSRSTAASASAWRELAYAIDGEEVGRRALRRPRAVARRRARRATTSPTAAR